MINNKTQMDLLQIEFKRQTQDLSVKRIRLCLGMGIIIFPLFVILDLVMVPNYLKLFFVFRLLSCLIIAILCLFTYLNFIKRFSTLLAILFSVVVGLSMTIMTRFSGGYESSYYGGLNLLFLGMGLLFPWRLRDALCAGILVYAIYLIPIFMFDDITNWAIFINNNLFITSTLLLSLVATYVGHKYRWNEYIAKSNLKISNKALEKTKSELEESYNKLQELDRLKTQFFTNIGHELRTPLTLILAPIDAMLKEENNKLQTSQIRALEVVTDNALRLLKLINHLLDLIRIDAHELKLHYKKINLSSFLSEIHDAILPLAKQKNVKLDFQTNNSAHAQFDREQMEKVILNIIYNAIKFTPNGGCIRVWHKIDSDKMSIYVQDSGIGIADDMKGKIFDRFSQAAGGTTRSHEGTGIGLALCRELVKLHGGTIDVESQLCKGSLFTISFPVQSPSQSEVELNQTTDNTSDWISELHHKALVRDTDLMLDKDRFSAQQKTQTTQNKSKILIVEDNPDLLSFLGSELQPDYYVLLSRDGQEALKMISQTKPDLIIADIMMPNMDGYEFCREIKQNKKTKDIPFIFLTAKADQEMKLEGYQAGADDYLVKPFNIQELKAKLNALISLNKLNQQLQKAKDEKRIYVEQMASNLAHEIRNPLQPIRTYLEALEENKDDPNFAHEMTEAVTPYLDRIQVLVNQLMHLGKIDKHVFAPTNPHQPIEETLKILEPKLKTRKIDVIREYATDNTTIQADRNQLGQVFFNLVKNAIEAMPKGGSLTIKTQKISKDGKDVLEISLKDTGHGIDDETMKKLFEPFHSTKKDKGTGLGLSISKQIIESHRGNIIVKSKRNEGSTFIIELPL